MLFGTVFALASLQLAQLELASLGESRETLQLAQLALVSVPISLELPRSDKSKIDPRVHRHLPKDRLREIARHRLEIDRLGDSPVFPFTNTPQVP